MIHYCFTRPNETSTPSGHINMHVCDCDHTIYILLLLEEEEEEEEKKRKRKMSRRFAKILTASDVSQKLAVPTDFLGDQYRGGERLKVMDTQTQKIYSFVLSTRQGPYRKPVFTKEWLKYSRDRELQAGQIIFFWKNDNEEFYRIQVLLDLLGVGVAGLQ